VVRTALFLWLAGGLLLLSNVFLFWSYLSGSTEKRAERDRLEESVVQQQKVVADFEARLAQLELGQQNEQVAFLNRKIAERTFSWSLLFERLSEVLPDDVRLLQLQPAAIAGDDRPGARPAPTTTVRGRRVSMGSSDRVPIVIQAEAKNGEAQLKFLDNLFAHPSFGKDADITRETIDEEHENRVRFDVRVTYFPASGGLTVEEEPVIVETPAPAAPPAARDETEIE
jgi:hypothetical protein